MIVKVCGMREKENIQELLALDIHIMGMIFYKKSPRYVRRTPGIKFPDTIKKAGVFVNAGYDEIMKKSEQFGLDIIQLHGNEIPELGKKLSANGLEVFKAFGIDELFDFDKTLPFSQSCSLFVFDSRTKSYGGSGKKYNWKKLNEYKGKTKFLLSGGIGPDDLSAVKNFSHPLFAGIDLNSGFEISPGVKDIAALKIFLNKIRKDH